MDSPKRSRDATAGSAGGAGAGSLVGVVWLASGAFGGALAFAWPLPKSTAARASCLVFVPAGDFAGCWPWANEGRESPRAPANAKPNRGMSARIAATLTTVRARAKRGSRLARASPFFGQKSRRICFAAGIRQQADDAQYGFGALELGLGLRERAAVVGFGRVALAQGSVGIASFRLRERPIF